MWIMAKKDYYHSRTGKKILTEGKQYKVINKLKDKYTIRHDGNKIMVLDKELFEIMSV